MNINKYLKAFLPRWIFQSLRKFRIALRVMMREYDEFRKKSPVEHQQFKVDRIDQWD
jgi:hypothetical protein